MSMAILLFLSGANDEPLTCQKQAIVELFRATASEKGTIADLTRLVANQGELEEGLLRCRLFPENSSKSLSAEQEERIREILRCPAGNLSECLAYLRYRWPDIFGRKIEPNEVMGPVTELNPATIVYRVRIGGQAVHFRFEEGSCQILTIQMPNSRSAFGDVECHWRRKAQKMRDAAPASDTPVRSQPQKGP
jgi:hypothetical protein